MDRASDRVTLVTVEAKTRTVGQSGPRGVAVALPAVAVNSSGRGRARRRSVMESIGWHGLATLSPVKVNGDAGVIGRLVRCPVDLERELVRVSAYRCRAM